MSPKLTANVRDAEMGNRMRYVTAVAVRARSPRLPAVSVYRQTVGNRTLSTRSRPSAVAGAIAGVIRDSGMAEVQSIGAGATNQAIKAVAIARSYLSEEGVDIVCTPSFIDVAIDDEERTAIRLLSRAPLILILLSSKTYDGRSYAAFGCKAALLLCPRSY